MHRRALTRRLMLSLLLAAWAAPRAAQGNPRSAFRVTQAQVSGSRLQITLAFDHPGSACRAEFFAHHRVPRHVSNSVHRGLPLGDKLMPSGKGSCTLSVELRALQQAGFTPGARLFVAADWPNNRHLWGTTGDGRPGHHAGTSFVVPDPAPAAASATPRGRRTARARRAVPGIPKLPAAPKAPSMAELLAR